MLRISFFRWQSGQFLLNGEQSAAIGLSLQCCGVVLVLLRQGLHSPIKLPPQVRPAAHHASRLRQAHCGS